MNLADLLKEDILQIACLSSSSSCSSASNANNDAARAHSLCACAATLHPFCFLFHNWVRLRLSGECSISPSEAIAIHTAHQDGEDTEGAVVSLASSDSEGIGSSDEESSKALDSARDCALHEEERACALDELATCADAVVAALEGHIGSPQEQRQHLKAQLQAGRTLSADRLSAAVNQIIEWYNVLSVLACSFPSSLDVMQVDTKHADASGSSTRDEEAEDGPSSKSGDNAASSSPKKTPAQLLAEQLEIPEMLLETQDAGKPLQPLLIGASAAQHAGQWAMALQALRETPLPAIERAAVKRWRLWARSHSKFLAKSVRTLSTVREQRPNKLLHEWLALNDYCDWVQHHFVELFTFEVLTEWYSQRATWCQGTANLAMTLCVGVESWQACRDFMNMRSRQFRHNPHAGAMKTVLAIKRLIELLRNPPKQPLAVYIELDCWRVEPEMSEGDSMDGASSSDVKFQQRSRQDAKQKAKQDRKQEVMQDTNQNAKQDAKQDTFEEQSPLCDPSDEMLELPEGVISSGELKGVDAPSGPDLDSDAVEVPLAVKLGFDPASMRSLGGHVFVIHIEDSLRAADSSPSHESDEAPTASGDAARVARAHEDEETTNGPGEDAKKPGVTSQETRTPQLSLSSYTVYSSWSGQYTLQDWLDSRPELCLMSENAFSVWLGALEVLLQVTHWNKEAEELLAFMFGADTNTSDSYSQPVDAAAPAAAPVNAVDGGGTPPQPAAAESVSMAGTTGRAGDANFADLRVSDPAFAAGEGLNEAKIVGKLIPGTMFVTSPVNRKPVPSQLPLPTLEASAVLSMEEDIAEPLRLDDGICEDSADDADSEEELYGDEIGSYDCWESPTGNWQIEYKEPVLWELHFWAQSFDRDSLEHNARVVKALQGSSRADHQGIVERLARENLSKLDRMQARTLCTSPFGHRCIRGFSLEQPVAN
ncbi:hypothetical protein AB1Y20_000873 [Prymnesium parvum]|uniref:Rab3 GTPase-activating protein catalytic subunit n=1 Tax=Prymnesium parvum TaxID=97485 RepID=A0AB34KBC6_PRYPA